MKNTTRIENEIKHSEYLATSKFKNWGWDSPIGMERLKRRYNLLSSNLNNESVVLEIGCGMGHLSKLLINKNIKLLAIDISPSFISENKNNIVSENIQFQAADAHQTNLPSNSYDYIIGCSVLHHLDLDLALNEFYRILKPGGKIFFCEPNMLNPHIAIQKNVAWIKKLSGDSPDESAFVRWKLKYSLKQTGFSYITITPFDFLYPLIPIKLIRVVEAIGYFLEKTPILKEFAGSLFISAAKPLS